MFGNCSGGARPAPVRARPARPQAPTGEKSRPTPAQAGASSLT
jgi:hypothetical protein